MTLDDQAAKALEMLRKQAANRGLPFDRYLAELAVEREDTPRSNPTASPHGLTPAEFNRWLIDVSAGMPELPPLPEDFSRAGLYDDHD